MQGVAWTDERLDDLSQRMDVGFDRVDRDIRGLRSEMQAGFTDMRGEINSLRTLILRMSAGTIASVVAVTLLHGI